MPGLPRTDNDLEQAFGAQRYHERRATGRKGASPAAVLRGEVRLIAATATRLHDQSAVDLARTDRAAWRSLRARLDQRRQARTLRTRFRRDPQAYLRALELKAIQSTLPAWEKTEEAAAEGSKAHPVEARLKRRSLPSSA